MKRVIHQTDGVAWLKAHPLPASHSIITSLPDASELPTLGFDGWRRWFIDAVKICLDACPSDSAPKPRARGCSGTRSSAARRRAR